MELSGAGNGARAHSYFSAGSRFTGNMCRLISAFARNIFITYLLYREAGRLFFAFFFFRFPRLRRGENIYGRISMALTSGPALLNRFVLYVSFDPVFLWATSHWLGIDRGDFGSPDGAQESR